MIDYKKLYLEKELSGAKTSRVIGWIMFLPALIVIKMFIVKTIPPIFISIASCLLLIMAPIYIIKKNKEIKELKLELESYKEVQNDKE